jgi:hydroxymethylpyrimidine/phosphomethylpyrimidine kinase
MIPNVLSIAGVDPSGGAGLLADLKAFSALGAYGTGVVTALTAQNTREITAIQAIAPAFVRQQIDTLFADVRIDAAKTGMLGTAGIVQAVAEGLAAPVAGGSLRALVVDPVMIAKSGDALLDRAATSALIEALLPQATVLTPNLPEAGVLLGRRAPDTLREMADAAERLRRLLPDSGRRWVLVKGGHLSGDPIDLLHDGDRMIELPARRIATRNTHGTGCTLSAAIAACWPRYADPVDAIRAARQYLVAAIARADELAVGRGHGPVQHFHGWWPAGGG